MKHLKKQLITDFELSELDFDFYDEMQITEEDDYNPKYVLNEHGSPDGEVIQIDRLIAELQRIKELGSNYVSLEHHCDHNGYMLAGYIIEVATETEITEYEQKKIKKQELKKEEEIKKLQAQLQKLTSEQTEYEQKIINSRIKN